MLSFPGRRRQQPTIHLTPLIDMVFLLLIYFLLTSNFVTQEGIDVELPEAELETTATEQLTVITVHRSGGFALADRILSDGELTAALPDRLRAASKPDVIIKADREAHYERVIKAMDIAKNSGARQLHLAVDKKTGSGPPPAH